MLGYNGKTMDRIIDRHVMDPGPDTWVPTRPDRALGFGARPNGPGGECTFYTLLLSVEGQEVEEMDNFALHRLLLCSHAFLLQIGEEKWDYRESVIRQTCQAIQHPSMKPGGC
ncbi:hypothetical protein SAY87_012115 [Trapa incisa]|uniref:Uncharacterized protein n=1 Tax=Trapa incisa TaxID=236973 RepID=A0AAN7GRR9_9MYRT|nr:hypothetical protein SAY87_012115 [Trapa incisa]